MCRIKFQETFSDDVCVPYLSKKRYSRKTVSLKKSKNFDYRFFLFIKSCDLYYENNFG